MAQESGVHTAYDVDLTAFLRQCDRADLEAVDQELTRTPGNLATFFRQTIRTLLGNPECEAALAAVRAGTVPSLSVSISICWKTRRTVDMIRNGESLETLINRTICTSTLISEPGVRVCWSTHG